MLSEEFVTKVSAISHDQQKLIELMNQLDEEKRSIRSAQRKWSNSEKSDGGLAGSGRYKKLRRLKDRLSFLIEEREYVRQTLGKLKAEKKHLNRASNRKPDFTQAFYAASEIILSDELFLQLEAKAQQLLEQR
ncbi:MAG TPA: hypothetical protein ENJ32_10520 [Crenotrichaceae bacterium]|nr:hypothetical protein [Crenotrichaceae bacterium]